MFAKCLVCAVVRTLSISTHLVKKLSTFFRTVDLRHSKRFPNQSPKHSPKRPYVNLLLNTFAATLIKTTWHC